MCSTVVYRYNCGHSIATTYKCKNCHDEAPNCGSAASADVMPPRRRRNRSGKRGLSTTDAMITTLNEPCQNCSGASTRHADDSDTRPADSPDNSDQEDQEDQGQDDDDTVLVRRGGGFVRVQPLRSRKLANSPPTAPQEASDDDDDVWGAAVQQLQRRVATMRMRS